MRVRPGSARIRVRAVAAALVGVALLASCRTEGTGSAAPTTVRSRPIAPTTTFRAQNGCRNVTKAAVGRAFPSLVNASLTSGGPGICFVGPAGTAGQTIWVITNVSSLWDQKASQPGWKVVRVGAYDIGTSPGGPFGGIAGHVSNVWVHNVRYSVQLAVRSESAALVQLQAPAGVRQAAGLAVAVLEAVTKNG